MLNVLTVTQETSAGSFVQTNKTQISDNPHSRSLGNALDALCKLTLDLQTDLDNLKGVCEDLYRVLACVFHELIGETYNLTTTSHTTSHDLSRELDGTTVLVGHLSSH
jgi:hypothetical protein